MEKGTKSRFEVGVAGPPCTPKSRRGQFTGWFKQHPRKKLNTWREKWLVVWGGSGRSPFPKGSKIHAKTLREEPREEVWRKGKHIVQKRVKSRDAMGAESENIRSAMATEGPSPRCKSRGGAFKIKKTKIGRSCPNLLPSWGKLACGI